MPVLELKDARLQLTWARRHLDELAESISDFVASRPYEVFAETKPETNRIAVMVRASKPIPNVVRMLTGDAIHSLRVPLDYLACELAMINAGDRKGAAFPFGQDAIGFSKEVRNKLGKLGAGARAFIEALEPYQGGRGHALWLLHRLDVGHKHLDVVVLGMQSATRSIGFSQVTGGAVHIEELLGGYQSLKQPLELMTATPGTSINSRIEIETSVGFGEGDVADGLEVLPTLRGISDQIERVLHQAEEQF